MTLRLNQVLCFACRTLVAVKNGRIKRHADPRYPLTACYRSGQSATLEEMAG